MVFEIVSREEEPLVPAVGAQAGHSAEHEYLVHGENADMHHRQNPERHAVGMGRAVRR